MVVGGIFGDIMKEKLIEAIKKAKENSKKRNFVQSMELIMNFSNVDFSKPQNRIDLEITLPKGRGKERKICAIVGDEMINIAKQLVDRVITKDELQSFDKKKAKKLANEYDMFVAQADLMPLVGRYLGQALGPRNKMPKPVPPNEKAFETIVNKLKDTVKIKTKGKFLPTLHTAIGTEDMKDEDLAENAEAVLEAIIDKLPNKIGNIKSIYVKTTMGKPVKVELK